MADQSALSHDADPAPHMHAYVAAAPAVIRTRTDYLSDMSAALASIGTPLPRNAMPDLKQINPQFAPKHLGYVHAISPDGVRWFSMLLLQYMMAFPSGPYKE